MCLYSHPNRLLIEHLKQTAESALNVFENKQIFFHHLNDDYTNVVKDLIQIVALSHDVGKATIFFQKYLKGENVNDKFKAHSLLSAVFALYIAQNYLQCQNLTEILLSSFVFSAVKHHHGTPKKIIDNFIDEPLQKILEEQFNNVSNDEFFSFLDEMFSKFAGASIWKNFHTYVLQKKYDDFLDKLIDIYYQQIVKMSDEESLKFFFTHQFIFSALIYGDKKNVTITTTTNKCFIDIQDSIKNFREKNGFDKPNSQIDKLKSKAYKETLDNVEKIFRKEQYIYSLTLPTGMGKTILALAAAEKIRQLAGLRNSKIIITIPFTSIIDQNFEVYTSILGNKHSDVILKHTHLSKIKYETENNVLDYEQSKFLIETWDSQIIVTTFVQFLETFLDNDKNKLMRFANLANSVVILDEIQTIRYNIWETIRETFRVLGKMFNIYFILSTATQPLIFKPEEEILELVPDYKSFFKVFNRTKLILKNFEKFDSFKQEVLEYIKNNVDKDVLIVMNTKSVTKNMFLFLRENIDLADNEIYYLTTFITPFERKEIINRIRNKSSNRKIIVSTQLIEAGVDISVDTIFRQLSPIDSIIQSAGRANRYNEKNCISEVFVCDIDELSSLSSGIYGKDLMVKTRNVLKNYSMIEEKDFLELIQKYYLEIRKQATNTTQIILQAMKELDFDSVDWKLIEEQEYESIFVALNDDAKNIWKKFIQIYHMNVKPWEKEKLFAEIKNEFYEFVVNVPIPSKCQSIDFDGKKQDGFYLWEYDNPNSNYVYSKEDISKNTGYSPSKKNTEFI